MAMPLSKALPKRVNAYRLTQGAAQIAKFLFLVVVCFTILYPFITKLSCMFMSERDLMDCTVKLVPKSPTWENVSFVFRYTEYIRTFINTFLMSFLSALCCVLSSCLIGWGLARYRFPGSRLLFALVIFITILPPQVIMLGLYSKFRSFDVAGLVQLLAGKPLRLVDTLWPTVILSCTGLIFRGGLFIFIMRQFYTGIPKELVEAARIDGCGHRDTFFRIVIPMSTAMMITVFLFSFCWMWSDTVYSSLFYSEMKLFANQVSIVGWVESEGIMYNTRMASVLLNTSVLLSMIPLLVLYACLQRFFVDGITRSGIVG